MIFSLEITFYILLCICGQIKSSRRKETAITNRYRITVENLNSLTSAYFFFNICTAIFQLIIDQTKIISIPSDSNYLYCCKYWSKQLIKTTSVRFWFWKELDIAQYINVNKCKKQNTNRKFLVVFFQNSWKDMDKPKGLKLIVSLYEIFDIFEVYFKSLLMIMIFRPSS